MKKFYFNMVLALAVVATTFGAKSITANAETESINWQVTYTGSKIESTYDVNKSTIENAMPGDTIEYSVDYVNGTSSPASFYVSADVVKSLEEGATATGGAYSYKITYTGSEVPLFDSETVGGDAGEGADAVIGLDQVNGNEGAYFSLGTVAAGDKGTVTVSITLDGNSQNNNYMSTLAQLEIKFGAEPTADATRGDSVTHHNSIVKNVVKKLSGGTEVVVIDDDDVPTTNGGGNPQTGDSIMPLVLCTVALLIGLMLIFWYFRLTKDNKEEVA